MVIPFEGLTPATSTSHARWVVDAMTGRDDVGLVIPAGFDAYARLLHPLHGGEPWPEEYRRVGGERYRYPFPEAVANVEGDLAETAIDALVPLLRPATSTPGRCHYGLWNGWGELHPGSHASLIATAGGADAPEPPDERPVHDFVAACAVQPWWGGRDLLLFHGPLEGVAAVRTVPPWGRRVPQWWWPDDRAWFVANEIDHPWTYVGGSADLVTAVVDHPAWEAVRVSVTDGW